VAFRRFKATLEQHGAGTVVVVPFDANEAFGSGGPPVRATVNGHPFRTTLFTMRGRVPLGLNREVREAARVEAQRRGVPSISSATPSRERSTSLQTSPKRSLPS
jgi:Domain of unknown function (DUF1905)